MRIFKYILFIGVLLVLQACSLSKNVPEGKYVLFENKIEGNERSNKNELSELFQQEPNTRIPLFNSSLGVTIYRMGLPFYDSSKVEAKLQDKIKNNEILIAAQNELERESKEWKKTLKEIEKKETQIENLEEKKEFGNLLMRTGNPLVILDSADIQTTVEQQKNYLINNGFFDAEIDYSVKTKKKKAYVSYEIEEKEPYLIDSFYTNSQNEEIIQLLKNNNTESNLKVGQIYTQDDAISERQRIETLLKNNGFYMFSKSYIEYNVYMDTSTRKLDIEQLILKPSFTEKHKVFTIDSITFKINSPSNDIIDQHIRSQYRNIDFDFYRAQYSAKLFSSRVFFEEGEVYNRDDFLETQKQLNNLDLFRFLNISFDTLGNSLTAKIFSQPNQKYQLTNQLGLSITEQLPGPFFSTSLRNRNFFSSGEILEFNFRAGLEGVASATDQGVYQSREIGTSASIIFPRFLIPFWPQSLQKFGRYNPNTRTLIGYNHTNRPEYTRNGLNGLLAYSWATRNNRQQFTLNLADVNYIRTPNITPEFLDVLQELSDQGNNLIWSFLPSFVSSVSAQSIINFNRYGNFQLNKAGLLRLFVESGGTTLNFLNIDEIDDNTEIANFQWLKLQADWRRYYPLDKKQTLAYRVNFGIAQPYGVSNGILPYEKYFFAGGGTSIRAWQARRLGPGSYTPPTLENGLFDYRNEQPAEMIFETMFEYRRNLFGYFDMALFIDAGNAWNIGIENSRPGSDFRFDRFYKEIAIGTGIGLRMDFDFLIIRLDMATKARDPAQPEGERWILDNISFKRPLGQKGQTVFNFGIGYPF